MFVCSVGPGPVSVSSRWGPILGEEGPVVRAAFRLLCFTWLKVPLQYILTRTRIPSPLPLLLFGPTAGGGHDQPAPHLLGAHTRISFHPKKVGALGDLTAQLRCRVVSLSFAAI